MSNNQKPKSEEHVVWHIFWVVGLVLLFAIVPTLLMLLTAPK